MYYFLSTNSIIELRLNIVMSTSPSANCYHVQFTHKSKHFTATRQRGRFAGFSLYVSNTTDRQTGYRCHYDKENVPPLDYSINCVSHGRFVIFFNERKSEATYPFGFETNSVFTELCEVTVQGRLRKILHCFQKVHLNQFLLKINPPCTITFQINTRLTFCFA